MAGGDFKKPALQQLNDLQQESESEKNVVVDQTGNVKATKTKLGCRKKKPVIPKINNMEIKNMVGEATNSVLTNKSGQTTLVRSSNIEPSASAVVAVSNASTSCVDQGPLRVKSMDGSIKNCTDNSLQNVWPIQYVTESVTSLRNGNEAQQIQSPNNFTVPCTSLPGIIESCQSDATQQQIMLVGDQVLIFQNQQEQEQLEEIKLEASTEPQQPSNGQTEPPWKHHSSFAMAVLEPVLPVRCKDTNAELHKSRFGSGNKGKCVKLGNEWYTPTEFESVCGRGNSKDWKRSIRFGGQSLQKLIQMGHITPHALNCACHTCVDDEAAVGPIRPFVPYYRKRRSQGADHSNDGRGQTKNQRLSSTVLNSDTSSDNTDKYTPSNLGNEASGVNLLAEALKKIKQEVRLPPNTEEAWKVVEETVDSFVNSATTLKSMMQEMKTRMNRDRETETVRSQQQSTQSQFVNQNQIFNLFESDVHATYTIQVIDPPSYSSVQANAAGLKCANCGRDGSLACSHCQRVYYCSAFCQTKDWPYHWNGCAGAAGAASSQFGNNV